MANTKPVKVSESEVKRAESMWGNFTLFSKWAIIATCVILAGLGIVFVQW